MNLKGTLPTLILQVLIPGPKHGYAIAQEIKKKSKGVLDFKEGTLYPALHAQENKGSIESYEKTENGRTRRYYQLTVEGLKVLERERNEWKELSLAITGILEDAK